MCGHPLSYEQLGQMRKCGNCQASFRQIGVNAILNATALLADLNDLNKHYQAAMEENERLETLVAAMTYAQGDADGR